MAIHRLLVRRAVTCVFVSHGVRVLAVWDAGDSHHAPVHFEICAVVPELVRCSFAGHIVARDCDPVRAPRIVKPLAHRFKLFRDGISVIPFRVKLFV